MAAVEEVRFVAADDRGCVSLCWTVWTNPDGSVYLAHAAGKALHASFHPARADGRLQQFHLRLSQSAAKMLEGDVPAFIAKWSSQSSAEHGHIELGAVLIPWFEISRDPATYLEPGVELARISVAPRQLCEVRVFIEPEGADPNGWIGRTAMGSSLVGRLRTSLGESVVIVSHQRDDVQEVVARAQAVHARLSLQLRDGAAPEAMAGLFAVLPGTMSGHGTTLPVFQCVTLTDRHGVRTPPPDRVASSAPTS